MRFKLFFSLMFIVIISFNGLLYLLNDHNYLRTTVQAEENQGFQNFKNADLISFYFPKLEFPDINYTQGLYNESNSLLIYESPDNSYHNISISLFVYTGIVFIEATYENCQDYIDPLDTDESQVEYHYNFVVYKVLLKAREESNRSASKFFPYTLEANGSYLVEDFGPTKNRLGQLEHGECKWVPGFESIFILPSLALITGVASLSKLRLFNGKKKAK